MEPDIESGSGAPTGPGRPLPSILLSGGGDVSLHNGHNVLVHFTVTRSLTSTAVTLSAGNLPAGVSASFSPAALPSGSGTASVTLELVAAPSAPAAQAAIHVGASGVNAISGTLLVHLTLVSPFGQVTGTPILPINTSGQSTVTNNATVVLPAAGAVTTGVNLEVAAGVEGNISLAISGGLPSGVSAQFEPAALTAPGAAGTMGVQIVLSATPNVTPEAVPVNVEARVGGELRGTLTFTLVIALGSNFNFFLYSSCKPLTGVSVTITVTENLVAAPPTPNQQYGFSFQLNASSAQNPANPNLIVWQQYIIGVGSGKIRGAVNNWTTASLSSTQTINPVVVLETLPQPDMIPAGYSLTIALANDKLGNVDGVTFGVDMSLPFGFESKRSQVITLTSLTKTGGQPVTSADLAPIVAFELNLVGPGDLKHANFISGAGTITYTASTALQPLTSLPPCVASTVTTGETSNSVYGPLQSPSSNSFTQSFSIKPAPVGVPKLTGLAPAAVLAALAQVALLPVEKTTTVGSTTPKPPVCVSQEPAPGTQVLAGSSVTYTIEQFAVGKSTPIK